MPNNAPPLGWAIYPFKRSGKVVDSKSNFDTQVEQGLQRYQRKHNTQPKIAIMHPNTIKWQGVTEALKDQKLVPDAHLRVGDIFFCIEEKDFYKK